MVVFKALYDYYFDGHIRISRLIAFLIAGPIVGLLSWWDNEGVFKAAKLDQRDREIRDQISAHKGDA